MRRLGDALVLTMTRGVTLAEWHRLGMIGREWALYRALGNDYARIVLVSGGDARELDIAREHCPGAIVVCNEGGVDDFDRAAPALVASVMKDTLPGGAGGGARIVVKTNQMEGGNLACAIASQLRGEGHAAALLARGGYCFSRFVGEREGFDSRACASARDEESRLCSCADAIICSTREMAADLAWRCGIALGRFHVVPNYVLMDDEPRIEARDGCEILAAGQLVGRKRVHLLIEAVALLARRGASGGGGVEPTLTIVGDGPLRQGLEDLARSRGVRATFLGNVAHSDLRQRMRAARVYAHASALEGHPKTVLEAMASGCAIVACDAPGTRVVLEHERTALLTRDEPEAIAGALERVLHDDALARSLAANAWQWARERVALDRVVAPERAAHGAALERMEEQRGAPAGGDGGSSSASRDSNPRALPGVRFDPALLDEPLERRVRAFGDAVGGFWKRLPAREGSRFLMGLDDALYRLHGHAAIADGGGLHPKHRLTRYHDFFCERLSADERVLDLGCGVGALACAMAQRAGARVKGIDLNEQSIERARARAHEIGVTHLVRFLRADITTIDGEACDTVVLSNVIEHLRDRAALLARWRETTGCRRFLIRVPMLERDWRVPWKRELGVEWRLDETHETEYVEGELRGELREAGLRAVGWITRWGEFWVEAQCPHRARSEA